MKNKSLTQKISLVTLFLLSASSLFGRTLAVDSNTESDLTSGLVAWYPLDGNASDMSGKSQNVVKLLIDLDELQGSLWDSVSNINQMVGILADYRKKNNL